MGSQSLAKRLIVSAVVISVTYYCSLKAPFFIFLIFNASIISIALYEFYTFVESKEVHPNKVLGIIFAILFPLFIFFPGEPLIFGAAILLLSFINFDANDKYSGFLNTAVTIFGIMYIGLFCSYFTKLKFLENGTMWVGYVIWVTKMGDAGAYFIGSSFGTVKLFKRVSPNKSVEGAIAGLVFSLIVSLIFKAYVPQVSLLHFIILGLLVGVIGQIGDLAESLIKRQCNVKDSGNVPGLGGVLDIMDSLIFTTPFLYYYLLAFVY